MVCLSLHGTTKLINRLSDDHDIDVLFWGDHFSEAVKVVALVIMHIIFYMVLFTKEFSTNGQYCGRHQ